MNIRDVTKHKKTEEKLIESEERYRLLFESSPESIVIVNFSGIIVDANPATEAQLGMKSESLIGRHFTEIGLIDTNKLSEYAARFQSIVLGKKTEVVEIDLKGPDGANRCLSIHTSRMIKNNVPYAFQFIIRDITERKTAENALRASEEYYRSILEHTQDIVMVLNLNGDIRFMSPSIASFGYTPEEVTGRNIYDYVHPDDQAPAMEANIYSIQNPGMTTRADIRMLNKEGRYKLMDGIGKTVVPASGSPFIVINGRDLSERLKAEEALRESEERYRALAESAKDTIFIVNRDGIIEYVNEYGAAQLGCSQDQLIGQPRDLLFPAGACGWQMANFERVFDSGEPISVEYSINLRNNEIWLDSQLVPITDNSGAVRAALGISRDASERKRLEQAKINFLSSVSHELRTPLSVILGYSEFLLNEQLPESVKNKLRIIHERGQQELKLVEELLDLAMFENKTPRFEMRDVPAWTFLNIYIEESRLTLANLIGKRFDTGRFSFQADLSPDIRAAYAHCDPERIKQVLDNLIDNAVKYSNRECLEFKITAAIDGCDLVIGVLDRGPGIPESERDLVFSPFYQVRKGKHPISDGVGKGLSIVKEYMEIHNGRVWIEERPGGGAAVYFSLPAKTEPAAAEPRRTVNSILVVDDDRDLAALMEDLLTVEGFTVSTAHNGASMYGRLGEKLPDLILLDVHLPDGNGPDLLRALKQNPDYSGIFVYLFSAKSSDELKTLCRESGGDGYISKPFEIADFIAKIEKI
ncbi:MAG: PAS domain S-box protein [bacterium]